MVKVRIGKEEIVYSDEDLENMTREQLKQLKQDLQCNMEDVSAKKARYNAENNEEINSKGYCKRIASYKTVQANIKRSIARVNSFMVEKRESDVNIREHWLWSFYNIAKNNIDSTEFNKFVKMTDEKAKYHVDVED